MIRILPLLGLLALGGCGFTPLYSEAGSNSIATDIREVHLARLTGPADASREVFAALNEALPSQGDTNSRYQLTIKLRDQRRAIAVTRSADTTRFDYLLQAAYSLTDTETGERRRRSLETVVSYGVVDSQYASLVGREDAVRRAALDLARKVEIDLVLYFKGRPQENSTVYLPDVVDGEIVDPIVPIEDDNLEDEE